MNGKKKVALLITALLAAVGIAVSVGSSAVTNAQGGVSHTTHLSNGLSVTEVQKPAITLDSGTMRLMATGSTTAWFNKTPTLACGNYQVTWDDLGSGSSWKQTGASTWNATNNSNGSGGCGSYNVRVYHKGPGAATPGVCGSDCTLSPGETSTLGTDYTGTGTSVMTWDYIQGLGCGRFYVVPGSWDHVVYPEGSPCPA